MVANPTPLNDCASKNKAVREIAFVIVVMIFFMVVLSCEFRLIKQNHIIGTKQRSQTLFSRSSKSNRTKSKSNSNSLRGNQS